MSVLAANAGDRNIASFRMLAGPSLTSAAAAAMRESARALGVDDLVADQLAICTKSFCDAVTVQAVEGEQNKLEVTLIDRPGAVVVRIDDPGMPWRTEAMRVGGDSTVGRLLRAHTIDGLHVSHRGRHGNRAEIVKNLPRSADDARSRFSVVDHRARVDAPAAPADKKVEIRRMVPGDAEALARCVYLSYGYSYDIDWIYDPAKIARMVASDRLTSFIGVADGEIVGHSALLRPSDASPVVEAGQAVVDPRYRGHHLFTSLKRRAVEWAAQAGLNGIYSEATAAHPYSQKANLALGASETGLLLGYIPSSVHYRGIETVVDGHRQSAVLFYLKTNDAQARPVFAPDRYWEVIDRIFRTGGLNGELNRVDDLPEPGSSTEVDVVNRRDHNQGIIAVAKYGEDLVSVVGERLRDFCRHGVDCVYVDLPLSDPSTAVLGDRLEALGFFFGGVFPNLRAHGDVLRLQYLNNVPVAHDDVEAASDLGRALLDYVLDSRASAGAAVDR